MWTSPLLDLLFEEPSIGRCLVAPDGSVLRANGEWLRSTGFSLDDVLGADVITLFPGTRDIALAMHARARAGHHVEVPRHAQTVNGRETWWEGSIDPIPMENGTGLLIVAREVADRALRVVAGCPATSQSSGPVDGRSPAHHAEGPSLPMHPRATEVLESISDAFVALDQDWRYTYVNRRAAELLGQDVADLIGRSPWEVFPFTVDSESYRECHRAMVERVPVQYVTYEPALGRWCENRLFPSGHGLAIYWSDITERKRAEQERTVTVEFLRLVNEAAGTGELVRSATTFFQRQSGCEAVGIRLKEGDDYPYYEAPGFPERFVLLENKLCRRDANGDIVLDSAGDPVVECMCGNVIRGRIDPGKPFFTSGGSFWSNDTTRLLATTTDADRQSPTRNRCNGEGYESVALVPLAVGGERLGLLQLNDRRSGMFSPQAIALWERLAGYLAVALAKSRSVEQVALETERLGRAEQALRESEARYRMLFQNILDGFAHCRMLFDEGGHPADFIYLDVNDAFGNLTGLRDVVGKKVSEVIPCLRESQPELLETYGRVVRTGRPERFEVYFSPLSMWLAISVYRTHPDHFVAVFDNITQRKRAEEALQQSEERLRALADSMPQLAWTARSDGYITWYNRRWYEFTGTTPEQMEGWGWQSVHDPTTLPAVLQRWKESIATGRSFEMEFPLRGADGKFRRFLTRVFPLRDPGGNVAQWFGTNTDVTELVEAQETLTVVTRLYAVLSRVNEAIVRTGDERQLYEEICRIVAEDGGFPLVWVGLVNERQVVPAASAGRATDYLREMRVEVEGELGQGPTGTCIREARSVINDDFSTNPSTWPWREPTSRHGLRASAAFPLRRAGQVIGALTFYASKPGAFTAEQVKLLEALSADISYALDAMRHERLRTEAERALRESEQSLREEDRRKNEFIAMLSHELRNPLAPIRHGLYLLDRAPPGSERAARAREIIYRQTGHLTRLVDDLLDVTRISRGKIELQRARVDAREVVRRACDDYRALFHERKLELRVETFDPVWIEADETRMAQVVGNLLHNAAKFSREGGIVTVSVGASDGQAQIRVNDDGIGISPELLPHLFEPFVQADGGLARTKGGLGLGLALVKGLAELHGGTARAHSEGAGRGAEFVVTLPSAAPPAQPARVPAATVATRVIEVLVIEDNVDAAHSIAEVLEMEGHRVHVATDGLSGIAKARELKPEVVLCDIGLPDVDGYQIARTLRSDDRLRSTRLVALSGYAQPEDRRRAAEAGFDDHVAKPPSLGALLASVAKGGKS